jgi:hypothetical protein
MANISIPATGRLETTTRVPEFFIVGHPKCGTSALCQMLVRHPQVYIPVKEPRFFVPELRSRFRQANSRDRPETLDAYLSLFADAGPEQRVGEASTLYLASEMAARRIAEVQPDARIIAILREPASFLRSLHLQALHNHVETEKDFRKAIELETLRREGKRIPRLSQSPQRLLYSDHIRYVEQLRRFHAVFPPEQVLVLIYDDYRRDNEATIRSMLRFLDVDDTYPIEVTDTKTLPVVRSHVLHQLMRAISIAHSNPSAATPISQIVNALTPKEVRSDALRAAWRRLVYSDPPPPDEALMLELRGRFKPEVEALSDYLGRDLVTLWGYDTID